MTRKYAQEEICDTKRFQKKFDAHITESREYRRAVYTRPDMNYSCYQPGAAMYEIEHRVEPLVAIHLPKEQFDRLLDQQTRTDMWRDEAEYAKTVLTKMCQDQRVRERNPVVAKAYQKYLTLLELCRN